MRKRLMGIMAGALAFVFLFAGCQGAKKEASIGVSFGVGAAARWDLEKQYMEQRAEELGVQMEVRLNRTDTPKTQTQDCIEMIDGGIDALILTPRDTSAVGGILAYAKEKKVPVISYARVVLGDKVDLFVGYDSGRIGQQQGQYLTELVYEGDYILLRGDQGDTNATLLYEGAMRYIDPVKDNLNILLDATIPGWSPEEAKKMVREAVSANNNHVDAILAPNDKIAGACAEALAELGVTDHVVITGMDAELDAVKRIVAGKQDVTFYMDLQELAHIAVDEAYKMAQKKSASPNAEYDNGSGAMVPAHLIVGKLITQENIDKILIESGYYSHEEVYGDDSGTN